MFHQIQPKHTVSSVFINFRLSFHCSVLLLLVIFQHHFAFCCALFVLFVSVICSTTSLVVYPICILYPDRFFNSCTMFPHSSSIFLSLFRALCFLLLVIFQHQFSFCCSLFCAFCFGNIQRHFSFCSISSLLVPLSWIFIHNFDEMLYAVTIGQARVSDNSNHIMIYAVNF